MTSQLVYTDYVLSTEVSMQQFENSNEKLCCLLTFSVIIIIIIYNLYRGKAPVTGSDFQGGPLRVKIKYTKAKNIQYN